MKKKLIIITIFILLLISLSLYYTYAIDVTIEEVESSNADLTFNINIEDRSSRTISVKAGETKYFDIFITNNNEGTINYGLAYDNVEIEGITIAQVDTSKNKVSELIEANTTHQISMVIINKTTTDYTYNIKTIVGYENGGDLIVDEGYTLISDIYSFNNNLDESGANTPNLVEGLIPITYYNNKWVKADTVNKDGIYKWYDYDNKKWANAVLVTSGYRDSNNNDTFDIGQEISEEAILAYYVWIPRYKYKVWNINKVIGTASYDAYNTGIDIIFEKEKQTTGTIKCNYDFTIIDGSLSEKCSGNNGDYYTHPAFWWDSNGNNLREASEELTGIWVGKFEVSSSTPNENYGGGSSAALAVRTKPNINAWRFNTVSNYSSVIQSMSASGNEYGLSKNAESHMIKNMEWGAVAYLTNSNYGRCTDGVCTEIGLNSYRDSSSGSAVTFLYRTGCGPQSATSTSSGSTCNEYNTELGQLASTTGNVYGIYDMSGGAWDYVMGNMSSARGSYAYYASLGGNNYTYSTDTAKYIDTYAYGSSNNDQSAYNRSRLGDATGEVVISSGDGWNSDYAYYVYSSAYWFIRGGYYNYGSDAGVFCFNRNDGYSYGDNASTRAAIVSLQ